MPDAGPRTTPGVGAAEARDIHRFAGSKGNGNAVTVIPACVRLPDDPEVPWEHAASVILEASQGQSPLSLLTRKHLGMAPVETLAPIVAGQGEPPASYLQRLLQAIQVPLAAGSRPLLLASSPVLAVTMEIALRRFHKDAGATVILSARPRVLQAGAGEMTIGYRALTAEPHIPLALVGTRSALAEEAPWIAERLRATEKEFQPRLTEIMATTISNAGGQALRLLIDRWKDRRIHVVVCADVFDPSLIRQVPGPVPLGLTYEALVDIFSAISECGQLSGVTFAGWYPRGARDDPEAQFMAYALAAIVEHILGCVASTSDLVSQDTKFTGEADLLGEDGTEGPLPEGAFG